MFVSLAALVAGIWIILQGETRLASTANLAFGIVVAVLALVELLRSGGYLVHRP